MKKNNAFGIMQGRLLPKYKGRYQAHPIGYWSDEFLIAKKIGLSLIEFIFDYDKFKTNPLFTKEGQKKIKSLISSTGIRVKSVCADYFMINKIHDSDLKKQNQAIKTLLHLMHNCDQLKIEYIILPFVDKSSINNIFKKNRLCSIFSELETEFKNFSCKLSLETDLSPIKFSDLLSKINQKKISVNYDSGNSASKGYDMREEFNAYGKEISIIHIKDRKFNSGPITLGKGDVNFNLLCNLINIYDYNGPLIFQTYRDKEGVEIFKKQFEFFKNIKKNYEK